MTIGARWALAGLALMLAVVTGAQAQMQAADWADLTAGLAGQTIPISLGTPDTLVLRGGAFPMILAQDGVNTMAAAARASSAAGAGRVVAFNKESYMKACGTEASPATALSCRLAVNSLRWASGLLATGDATSFRLALSSTSIVGTTGLNAIKTAAAALGFTIALPTGLTSHVPSDLTQLTTAAGVRIADVLLTDSYSSFTDAQRTGIASFVQAGGGLVLGGQAWSTGGNITMYAGNQLLAAACGGCVQWTGGYGDARSVTVATTAPDARLFNADLAAQSFLDHVTGVALLPADVLTKVTATVKSAIDQSLFTWATPASSPSAALWASFGSRLDVQMSTTAAAWTCGSVSASVPENVIAAAYLSKRNNDMLPEQMTALPCASNFPGAPAAGAVPITSTMMINVTYAGTFSGPMPPRGGLVWRSTGLRAPAGQAITVTIPSAVAAALTASGGSLGVQIGSHSDGISHKSSWCRLPAGVLVRRWFTNAAAGGNSITLASGLGGLVYITTAWGNTQGPIDVTVSGAIQAPFFFKGKTTEDEWRASLRNAPAPWAEIGSDKFVFTVPSASIRNLDNPQAVVDLWDTVLDGYADLTVYTRDRPRAERVVLDCDISAGWMHSGYPIMAYQSEAAYLQLPNWIGRDNGWGWFHELGHNNQWDAWTLPNQGEVTCNLYSLWASENIMKMNRTTRYTSRAAGQAAYFASGVFPTDFETTTGMYQLMQLQENAGGRLDYAGGWAFWSRFLARMQVLQGTAAVATTDAKIQTWIVETSKAANKNLINFYRAWKFPITPDTEAACSSLPSFDFDPTTCGIECSNCCLPGSLSPTVEQICRQTVPAGWAFYSKKDSGGNDLYGANVSGLGGNWTAIAALCGANPWCRGVTTSGWLKHTIRPEAEWTQPFGDACAGLLVMTAASPAALPSAMTSASTLQVAGNCIEITGGTFASGTRLALGACTGTAAQVFQAGPAANANRIQASNTASGTYCFDVTGGSSTAGTAVVIWSCGTGGNQRWATDTAGRLVPRHATTMCLDTEGGSLAVGAKLVINPCSDAPSQKIVAAAAAACTGTPTITNGAFACGATASGASCAGTCLAGFVGSPVAACWNGAYTVTGSCIASGPISSPSTLVLSGTNLCVAVSGNNANSARLQLAACTGSGAQPGSQLFVSGTGSNTKRLQTASTTGSTYCFDVSGGGTTSGSRVILYSCGTQLNQQWTQDSAGRWRPGHVSGMCLDTTNSVTSLSSTTDFFVINRCNSTVILPSQVFTATPLTASGRHRKLSWSRKLFSLFAMA